jgi:hypothetical protein
MAQPFKTWTVLPHGKVSTLDDKLLTVVGDLPMPFGGFPCMSTPRKPISMTRALAT